MESIDKLREIGTKVKNSCFTGVHCDTVLELADEIEAEIAERYMKRPVDADGVPWHIGEEVDGCEIVAMAGYQLYYYDDDSKTIEWCIAKNRRHVKPRTLEDVLEDYVVEYQTRHARSKFGAEHFDHVDVHEMVKRYADEIRELLGGDAE